MSERIIIRGLKSLEENAIRITEPIEVVTSKYVDASPVVGRFDPTYDLEEVDNCYREVNDIIAFIHGDALYVIPSCEIVRVILKKMGFMEDMFLRVPFIWGEYPKNEHEHWKELRKWQFEQMEKDVHRDRKRRKQMGYLTTTV